MATTSSPSGSPPSPLSTMTPAYQSASPFFTVLPYEIRQQIYLEAFHTSSLRQHILMLPNGHFTHTPCITSPLSPDLRFAGFRNAPLASLERATWLQRLKTEWCLHWACEEAHLDKTVTLGPHSHPSPSTFLPVLLTCKQTYLEALPSLYRNLTFLFTDLTAAETFLFTFPRLHHPIRNLELSIRLSNLLTELYFPYAEVAAAASATPIAHGDGPPPTIKPPTGAGAPARLTATNNPWSRVCDRLLALSDASALSHLHIWLDTRDLRPWHKRVSETRMFGPLTQVRMRQPGGQFVLALPEVPGDLVVDGPPVQQVLTRGLGAEHFLTGDGDGRGGEGRGFKVERGVRANNWRYVTYEIYLLRRASRRGMMATAAGG